MEADDLRAALRTLRLSQAALARRINYTPVTIWQMLHNKRPISPEVAMRVEDLLRESER